MNFKEPNAIYLQIADRISDEILQSVYGAGERIPAVREYASLVEVNTNTAMRAYDSLASQGIITNQRGIGYFVTAEARDIIMRIRREHFLGTELPECFRQAVLLGIQPDELAKLFIQYFQQK